MGGAHLDFLKKEDKIYIFNIIHIFFFFKKKYIKDIQIKSMNFINFSLDGDADFLIACCNA